MDGLRQDIRYALRSLRRTPAFTLAALATLALGIGPTTAIFSVVNAVLLEPPPYPAPDRIVVLGAAEAGNQDGQIFHYVRDRARSFQQIAAHGGGAGWNLVLGDRAEYVTGMRVSEGFFEVLGVTPLVGRGFSRAEDQANGPRAVVLGEPLWRRVFGSRRDVLGETVLLGGVAYSVVGVMPAGFRTMPAADLWTPLRLAATDNSWNYTIIGRLASGVALADAERELASLKPGLHRDLRGISEARSQSLMWISYQRWLGMANRRVLLLLLGAVSLLLLIACANVASLQLVRAIGRHREMATRSAVGAGHLRLIRQVLTESAVLGMCGAVVGLVAGTWGVRGLLALVPSGLLEGRSVDLDWRVLTVSVTVAIGAGIFFGLAPAIGVARLNARRALWEGARNTAGRSATWLRRIFATGEVALAIILMAGAGLFIRTFVNLRGVELGFQPDNVIVGKMSFQGSTSQTRDSAVTFFEQTLSRLRAVPGVTAAAVGNSIPIERALNLPLEPPAGALVHEIRAVDWRYVTPEYFSVFGIRLRAGRPFDARDGAHNLPVALINEAFARTYFGNAPPVGQVVQLVKDFGDPPRQVIGVIADVRNRSGSGWTRGLNALGAPVAPMIYVPAAQVPDDILQSLRSLPVNWAVRTTGSAETSAAVQDIIKSADPRLPVIRFDTMQQVIARDLELQRFMMTLLSVFAALSMALAAVGIYGLIAYATSQRRQEVGIRVALGATRLGVLRPFLVEGLSLVSAGVFIGVGGAAIASGLVQSLMFGVEPFDPLTFGATSVLLVLVTGVATLVPAWQASRIDPMRTLRQE